MQLPKKPRIKLPNVQVAPIPLPTGGLPSSPFPRPPIPPRLGRFIPPRTLTGLVPPIVRDLTRFASIAQHVLPAHFGGLRRGLPQLSGPVFNRNPQTYLHGLFVNEDNPSDIMRFQFNPEEIEIDQQVGWIISDVPGRSHPFVQWGGSGQKRYNFTLKMAWMNEDDGQTITDAVNWLQSFLLPSDVDQQTGLALPPKRLKLMLGKITEKNDSSTAESGILVRCKAKYSRLFRPDSLMPLYAEVSIEFLALLTPGKYIETMADARTSHFSTEVAGRVSRATVNLPSGL